jgi:haloacid dehalogenase-like hydrolase
VVIFDCNGVLVDSEPLATTVVSQEFMRAGFSLTPDVIVRYFAGRRPAEMYAEVEQASGRKLPADFAATVMAATLRRFRAELRAIQYMSRALSWLRGPKCVASSSTLDRIRLSLETTDLIRFFDPHLFSAADVQKGKPAADLFLHGRRDRHPAGRLPGGRGFAGRGRCRHDRDRLCRRQPRRTEAARASAPGRRARRFSDMRALKSTVIDLRGW